MPTPRSGTHAPKAVERFIFFRDAVFAFAITLLAAIAGRVPVLICYVITFVVVSQLWIRHHKVFEKLTDYDRPLIALNFALLFCVSVIPFAIDLLLGSKLLSLSIEIYAGVLTANGLAGAAVW